MTLDKDAIATITKAAATTTLGEQRFVDVTNAAVTDFVGQDALQITIVLTPGATDSITGDHVLRTLDEIRTQLQRAGEERLPIVEYATEDELNESDAILNPDHLFDQADNLIASANPRQADLKRAISSAYYGLFHAALTRATDQVVGVGKRSSNLYELVYRSVDHTRIRTVCNQIASKSPKIASYMPSARFGIEIKAVAQAIIDMQEKRHTADYNPLFRARKSGVELSVREARTAFQRFQGAPAADVEAFSLLLFFKPRE